jgi:hypothetical protein
MKDLSKTTVRKRWKYFSNKNEFGYYQLITGEKTKKSKGSYLNYVKRSSEILNAPEMIKQIRNYKKIFWQAYKIHWVDKNINTIT